MTEATKSTAVAKPKDALESQLLEKAQTPEERALAFRLASDVRKAEMVRNVAVQLAETGWGKNISPVARAAVARYCYEIGGDPVRHVFVLGGNIFINGTYYRDVVAANPLFDHADDPQWFHHDERATPEDQALRRGLRVEHNIPDDCPAACLLVLHYKGRGPFKGIGRVRAGLTENGKPKDPVGLEFPRESAETRAWREAGEKAEPVWFRHHPSLAAAEAVLTEARTVAHASAPELPPGDEAPGTEAPAVVKAEPTVRHLPTALCPRDDAHAAADCGYERAHKALPAQE